MTLLNACTLRSEFNRPEIISDQSRLFLNTGGQLHTPETIERWWERLNDPILNSHVEELLRNNLTLIEASERTSTGQRALSNSTGTLVSRSISRRQRIT